MLVSIVVAGVTVAVAAETAIMPRPPHFVASRPPARSSLSAVSPVNLASAAPISAGSPDFTAAATFFDCFTCFEMLAVKSS